MTAQQSIAEFAERCRMARSIEIGGKLKIKSREYTKAREKLRERDAVEDILFEILKAA